MLLNFLFGFFIGFVIALLFLAVCLVIVILFIDDKKRAKITKKITGNYKRFKILDEDKKSTIDEILENLK